MQFLVLTEGKKSLLTRIVSGSPCQQAPPRWYLGQHCKNWPPHTISSTGTSALATRRALSEWCKMAHSGLPSNLITP